MPAAIYGTHIANSTIYMLSMSSTNGKLAGLVSKSAERRPKKPPNLSSTSLQESESQRSRENGGGFLMNWKVVSALFKGLTGSVGAFVSERGGLDCGGHGG